MKDMLNYANLVGCLIDIWFNKEDLLVESCTVRAMIDAVSGDGIVHLLPLRIWASNSHVWIHLISGDFPNHEILAGATPQYRSQLFPSRALELRMFSGRTAVIYRKGVIPPAEPNKFLLGEKRISPTLF